MDWSLPGSSVHGIFQARVLEWGAIAFSDGYATLPIRVNRLTVGIRMERRNFSFFFLDYLFLGALGLRCCMQAFSGYGQQGRSPVAVCGLLVALA